MDQSPNKSRQKSRKRTFALIKYAVKRLLLIIPLLLLVTMAVFVMLYFAKGDPATLSLGVEATPEKIAATREAMGLNKPLHIQYWDFLKNLVLHGDLGKSYQSGRPVIAELGRTFPVSLTLALSGILVSVVISILIGVLSAVKQYSFIDAMSKLMVIMGVSMPVFWLGLLFIVIFSLKLGWFPGSGWGDIKHMILPVAALSAYPTAALTRMTRSSMLEVIRQDYIRTARSKGLSERAVVFKHALKNACIPVITLVGIELGVLIGGSILTETVFSIPGLGRLMVTAVFARDYPIIRGGIIAISATVAIINLLVDLSYTLFNPKIQY
jgi:peptide/nickel transport system permease protein